MNKREKFLQDKRLSSDEDFDLDEIDLDTDSDINLDEEVSEGVEPYNIEKNSKVIIGERLKAIREAEKKWSEDVSEETDTDFYFQVVFRNPTELNKFVTELKLQLHHDDFIFGEDLMESLEKYFKKKYK